METTESLNWETLITIEPRLVYLENRIEAIKAKNMEYKGQRKLAPSYADKCWYGYPSREGIRTQMTRLVGWNAAQDHDVLSTQDAYDIAYQHLYSLMISN